MVQEGQVRKKYPSDLTDEQWVIVEPLIPPAKRSPRGGRPRKVHMREVLNTMLYLDQRGHAPAGPSWGIDDFGCIQDRGAHGVHRPRGLCS